MCQGHKKWRLLTFVIVFKFIMKLLVFFIFVMQQFVDDYKSLT